MFSSERNESSIVSALTTLHHGPVVQAEARVARAAEIAEQAENHAANVAAMERGYQEPEDSQVIQNQASSQATLHAPF